MRKAVGRQNLADSCKLAARRHSGTDRNYLAPSYALDRHN